MSGYSWSLPASSNQQVAAVQEQSALLLGKDILFRGDYAVTAAGDYVLIEGLEALRQAIYRRLITRPGEFQARPEYGVGVLDFVKKRRSPATYDELRQRVVDQLSLDPRISAVVDVVVESITDGIQVAVVIEAAGETLKFEPYDFRERETIGTIAGTGGVGLNIGRRE